MNRFLNFSRRNFKEVLRDPIIYIFCIGFPVIMLIMFQIINNYTGGNTPIFDLNALLPAIIVFSYTFVMLTVAILVSKDRQTFFLKRLFSSPMNSCHFILGYSFIGIVIGFFQTIICLFTGFLISLFNNSGFISLSSILLLFLSQFPILVINVFLGVFIGSLFNDRAAPGIASIFISLAGMLGGCWMPVETMGNFELFCKCLPFYPSVCLGRTITGSVNALGESYVMNIFGLITILVYMVISIVISIFAFKKSMINDN